MGKILLSKKHKVMLGLATGVLSSAAIVTPLASCSCSTNETDVGSLYDREFDVSEATYENMKDQLDYKINGLITEQARTEIGQGKWENASEESVIDTKKQHYNSIISDLDNRIYGLNGTKKESASKVICAMSEMAADQLKFTFDCGSSASWSDLQDDYRGAYNEAENYMISAGIEWDKRAEKLEYARQEWDKLRNALQTKYGQGNALAGLVQGRQQLLTLFDGIEQDTTFDAAETKLKDFLSNYTIQLKDPNLDPTSNETSYGKYYEDIEGEWEAHEKAFNLYKYEDPTGKKINVNGNIETPTPFQEYFEVFDQDGRDVTNQFTQEFFEYDAIPGYHLQPCMRDCQQYAYSNKNVVSVDWKLLKSHKSTHPNHNLFTLPNNGDLEVHLYKANEDQAEKMKKAGSVEEAMSEATIDYKQDGSICSDSKEGEALKEAYFPSLNTSNVSEEGNDIEFLYKEKPDLEKFEFGVLDKAGMYTLGINQLADTGVYLKDNNDLTSTGEAKLSDLLDFRDQEIEKPAEEQIPDDDLSTLQKFIKYCDFLSIKVKEEPSTDKTSKITINSLVKFANSKYRYSTNTNSKSFCVAMNHEEDKLTVSDNFFKQVCDGYNDTLDIMNMYQNNDKFEDIQLDTSLTYAGYAIVAAIGAIVTGLYILSVIFGDPASKVIAGICIALNILILAFNIISACLFNSMVMEPVDRFFANVEDFKKYKNEDGKTPFDDVRQKLSDDKGIFAIKKDGDYNNAEFQVKKAEFNNNDDKQALNKYYYGFKDTAHGKTFVDTADQFNVGVVGFNDKLNALGSNSKFIWINVGLTIASIALAIIAFIITPSTKPAEKKAVEEERGPIQYTDEMLQADKLAAQEANSIIWTQLLIELPYI